MRLIIKNDADTYLGGVEHEFSTGKKVSAGGCDKLREAIVDLVGKLLETARHKAALRKTTEISEEAVADSFESINRKLLTRRQQFRQTFLHIASATSLAFVGTLESALTSLTPDTVDNLARVTLYLVVLVLAAQSILTKSEHR